MAFIKQLNTTHKILTWDILPKDEFISISAPAVKYRAYELDLIKDYQSSLTH